MQVTKLARTGWLLLGLMALLALSFGCTPTSTPSNDQGEVSVSLFGFSAGSSTQMRVDAVAEALRLDHPDWQVSSMAAGGEARLMEERIAGEADLFFPPSPRPLELELHEPLHPDIDFAEATEYRLMMPSSYLFVHLLTQESTGLETPADIIERQYPFRAGSGGGVSILLLERIFAHYGSSLDEAKAWGATHEVLYMSSPDGVAALQSGRLDLGFTWLGIPTARYQGVTADLKLLRFDDSGLVEMFADLGCIPESIPAGTYPFVREDVPTVAAPQPLVIRADMPENLVYEIAKSIFNHKHLYTTAHADSAKNMTPEAVAAAVEGNEGSTPAYHPGALKYYREMGWIS